MNVLITGATGFLGSKLALRFVQDGYDVLVVKRTHSDLSRIRSIENDIRMYDIDVIPLERIFEECQVDAIVHCATNYGREGASAANVVETNLILPLRLLQLASDSGARAFINSDTILDPRISHYSLSKKQFVEWMSHFATDMACMNVALEHFFGPGDDPSKFASGIVHALLREVPSIDLTPGEQKRDFIYIDDVVDAFSRILVYSVGSSTGIHRYEVGTNEMITINEFVRLAYRLAGSPSTELRFGALPYRQNEVMDSHVDTSALRALGWVPRVRVEEGLKRTIEMEREIADGA